MAGRIVVVGNKVKWTARALMSLKVAKLNRACGKMVKGNRKLSIKMGKMACEWSVRRMM